MLKVESFVIGPIETNCYIAYDTDTGEGLLIDPALYDSSIAEYIRKENIDIKYIINTHGHYDHIGGDGKFGYPILIHEKDADCLANPVRSLSFLAGFTRHKFAAAKRLKDGDEVRINNLVFSIIHLPGHSPGGIGIQCNDVIYTGDTLFFESVGRTDIPFAKQKDLQKSLERLMLFNDKVRIYPGHGPQSTIGYERLNNPFIKD